jgi:predicted RND superfamily exporter protein
VVQIRTTVGDAGAERLEREVEAAFAPVADTGAQVTVTSEPIIIAEMSEDLSAFQARAIASTLLVVLVLLAGYYTATRRRPLLGLIALVPATVSASLVVGSMRLLGISFNVLTATLTAIAVGIGVPYGVHVVNRFVEDLADRDADRAITRTLRSTGGALTGSALTTLGAFVVLAFSGLPPIRSLGLLGGAGIAFALLAAVLVEPGALALWARRHRHAETDRGAAPRTTVTA